MTAAIILGAVCVVIVAAILYADAKKWDPFPWLYGTTDPRELVERARDRGRS